MALQNSHRSPESSPPVRPSPVTTHWFQPPSKGFQKQTLSQNQRSIVSESVTCSIPIPGGIHGSRIQPSASRSLGRRAHTHRDMNSGFQRTEPINHDLELYYSQGGTGFHSPPSEGASYCDAQIQYSQDYLLVYNPVLPHAFFTRC